MPSPRHALFPLVFQPIGECLSVLIATLLFCGCGPSHQSGKIVGGSMAPAFLGVHHDATCPDCGITVKHESVHSLQSSPSIVCPNCGCSEFASATVTPQAEDCVNILSESKSIERWDVIAFKRPGSDSAIVKRVVGLPLESLVIDKGNLWVNNAILKKPIFRQKEMRILVNDSKYRADRRWVPTSPNSNWKPSSAGYSFHSSRTNSVIDWNEFLPQRCYAHSVSVGATPSIEDNYGYNQTLGRNLNPIDEIYVELLEIKLSPNSIFGLRFAHRTAVYEFQLDVKQNQLSIAGIPGLEKRLINLTRIALKHRKIGVEISTFDHHLIFQIDGNIIFDHSIPPPPGGMASRPIQFGATGGDVHVGRIRIWRDVYYLGPNGNSTSRCLLASDKSGYLVLGDNAPISRDSRHWNPSEIEAKLILGRVNVSEIK